MKKLFMLFSFVIGCTCIANAQSSDQHLQNLAKRHMTDKIVRSVEEGNGVCTTSNGTKGTMVTTSRDVRTIETKSNSDTKTSGSYSSHTSASVNAGLTNSGISAQNGVTHNSGNSSRSNGTTTTIDITEHQTCVEKKQ